MSRFSLTKVLCGLEDLWSKTTGDPEVCIALLDGPVDLSHDCFHGAKIETVCGVEWRSPSTGPAARHGTQVASILFGQQGTSLQGIAPACRGVVIPIFRDGIGQDIVPCSQIDLARAINYALQYGSKVINVSGGQIQKSDVMHPLLRQAVEDCRKHRVLIVAAVGNDGCQCIHVPAAEPSVLAVGAMDTTGQPFKWSNWGRHYEQQGILGPGENIPCAVPKGGVVLGSGTSLATPIVTGVVALLMSLQRKYGLTLDPVTIRAAILETAVGCEEQATTDCSRLLGGRLSLGRVVHSLFHGGEYMSDPFLPVAVSSSESILDQNGIDTAQGEPRKVESTSVGVSPASCGCSSKPTASEPCLCGAGSQMVYALGQLGYDFGTEARRDSIQQHMGEGVNPYDADKLLSYLEKNPWDAAEINWTLALDGSQIYAVAPRGSFAQEVFLRLRSFLSEQLSRGVERISVPGRITGSVTLLNGQVVPVIDPVLRGMHSWTIGALVTAVCGDAPPKAASEKDKIVYQQKAEGVANYLRRVYAELRNLGLTSRDRALNYSAANALLVARVFQDAAKLAMELDSIAVEPSPISRPGSDSWDVKLMFFDPSKAFERARKVYAFTVDVSDCVPLMVGELRTWFSR
jgi:hypothetical protein